MDSGGRVVRLLSLIQFLVSSLQHVSSSMHGSFEQRSSWSTRQDGKLDCISREISSSKVGVFPDWKD